MKQPHILIPRPAESPLDEYDAPLRSPPPLTFCVRQHEAVSVRHPAPRAVQARLVTMSGTTAPPAPAPAPGPPTHDGNGNRIPLRHVLPPLILGTATFNTQYVADPLAMPYRNIVARAVDLGIAGFDTSPYYGPSEILLGTALNALMNPTPTPSNPHPPQVPRSDLVLITKAGRIKGDEFDYSPAYIRYSVLRSLKRLHTTYLDLVYMHDVEFVSPAEVIGAVRELRRLRDEGLVRFVGISGFPVGVLCELAEMIRAETGEPLDAVLSYGHFTVQNRQLGLPWVEGEGVDEDARKMSPLGRFKAAGVDVVLNASILGMGLLTSRGIPADPELTDSGNTSPLAVWHPSPPELRVVCKTLATIAAEAGERLESVAIRWAMEEWARVGAIPGISLGSGCTDSEGKQIPVGPTVCGVSSISELEETVAAWSGVLSAIQDPSGTEAARRERILDLVQNKMWPVLGAWKDFVWASPGPGFVNQRRPEDRGVVPDDDVSK